MNNANLKNITFVGTITHLMLFCNSANAMILDTNSGIMSPGTLQASRFPVNPSSANQSNINQTSVNPIPVSLPSITQNHNDSQFHPVHTEPSMMQKPSLRGRKTCMEAFQASMNNGIYGTYCVLDLSNTSDFEQNADIVTQQFVTQMQGAGMKYIYIDLYNSFVTDSYVSKWATKLKQAGIQVLWNLSGNKTVTDQTITVLGSLDNVIGLNIAGTSVTDIGINQLINMLSNAPVAIDFINIYRCQISENISNMLESKFNENVNKWNVMYPNQIKNRRGIIKKLGVDFEKKFHQSPNIVSGSNANNVHQQLVTQQIPSNNTINSVNTPMPVAVSIPGYTNSNTVSGPAVDYNSSINQYAPTTLNTKNNNYSNNVYAINTPGSLAPVVVTP